MTKQKIWMIVTASVLILGIGALLWILAVEKAEAPTNTNTGTNTTANENAVANVNWSAVANTNENVNSSLENTNTSLEPVQTESIFEPGDDLRVVSNPDILLADSGMTLTTIDAGTLQSSKYQGQTLYLVSARYDGPATTPQFYRFVNTPTGLVLLAKQSEDPAYALDPAKYTVDADTMISELDFPATITGPSPRQSLELDEDADGFFHSAGRTVAFTHPTYGDVYTDPASTSEYFPHFGFYLRAPDGTVRTYKLVFDFIGSTEIPAITWNDGTTNTTIYNVVRIGGCGAMNYANVVNPEEVVLGRDLERVGVTNLGDAIYALKDTRHERLLEIYDSYATLREDGTKQTYEEFLADRPLIYFLDPFDRLIQAQNTKFQPLAECGKPVIYLYPEKTTDVSVQVAPTGGFSKTEPAYNNGWKVTATPAGHLTDRATGNAYPYLFWEGRSNSIYETPKRGWVVTQNEVQGFLLEKLAQLGLNAKERADFIEFWGPRMQSAPYYFISFLGNREMNQLAPLSVDPKPDTIIRVLMDFMPLEKPIDVKGYDIKTPERKGFTLLEWGGVLR